VSRTATPSEEGQVNSMTEKYVPLVSLVSVNHLMSRTGLAGQVSLKSD